MRICTLGFDAFGDMVLREPFYRALLTRGHRLSAVTREEYRAILPYISPAIEPMPVARVDAASAHPLDFAALEPRLRRWRPDAIVVLEASFWTTPLAADLSAFLKRFSRVFRLGMSFVEYPLDGAQLGYSKTVKVAGISHECEKYRKLLAAWLRLDADLQPRLHLPEDPLDRARGLLQTLALEPGRFAVCCPEGSTLIKIKAMPVATAVGAARHLLERHGLPTLFVGVESERAALQAAVEQLTAAALPARLWIGATGTFDLLMGLLAQARLYVGCDTGPMHIAAALGLPVLAIFGGGTYPRFLPATPKAVTLTQKMPCSPCSWRCSYPAPPPCIAMVALERVREGIDHLLAGAVGPVHYVGGYGALAKA